MEESKIVKYVSIANMILLVIAGVLGYFFVERYNVIAAIESVNASKASVKVDESQAELNHAKIASIVSENLMNELELRIYPTKEALDLAEKNTNVLLNLSKKELVQTESKLKTLELELKEINEQLNRIDKKTQISLNISTLLNDIQPSMKWTCSICNSGSNYIEVCCNHENIGNHKFRISAFDVRITNMSSGEDLPQNGYTVANNISNTIGAGGTGGSRFKIIGLDYESTSNYKITITTKARTIKDIVTITKGLMKNVVEYEVIDSLSTQGYTFNLYNRK